MLAGKLSIQDMSQTDAREQKWKVGWSILPPRTHTHEKKQIDRLERKQHIANWIAKCMNRKLVDRKTYLKNDKLKDRLLDEWMD